MHTQPSGCPGMSHRTCAAHVRQSSRAGSLLDAPDVVFEEAVGDIPAVGQPLAGTQMCELVRVPMCRGQCCLLARFLAALLQKHFQFP